MKTTKKKFSFSHAHDYSTIEFPNGASLDIGKPEPYDPDDRDEIREYEEIEEDVETVVKMLNEHKELKNHLKWALKQMRSLGMTEEMENRYAKAEKLTKGK